MRLQHFLGESMIRDSKALRSGTGKSFTGSLELGQL